MMSELSVTDSSTNFLALVDIRDFSSWFLARTFLHLRHFCLVYHYFLSAIGCSYIHVIVENLIFCVKLEVSKTDKMQRI